MRISAYYHAVPGSSLDKAVRHAFEDRGGRFIGSGTMLVGKHRGERDVEYEIADELVEDCVDTLKKLGVRTARVFKAA